jgi:hypothetical protein
MCKCQRNKPYPATKRIREDHLRKARTLSCGCYRSELMRGNRKQTHKATVKPVLAGVKNGESSSGPTQNEVWAAQLLGTNLNIERDNLPKCAHGVYLAHKDKAVYCQFCTPNDKATGSRVHTSFSASWNTRLRHENLAVNRGIALSTTEDQLTSTKARVFSPTADKVWAGGKNLVLAGGSAGISAVSDTCDTRERIGGKKRSATGFDKIRPWQNPNVDHDETADECEALPSYSERGDPEIDRLDDRRVLKTASRASALPEKSKFVIKFVRKGLFQILKDGTAIGEYPSRADAVLAKTTFQAEHKAERAELRRLQQLDEDKEPEPFVE